MTTATDFASASYDELRDRAEEIYRARAPGVVDWIERLRPEDGARGRFRWALETTRPANVGASGNILCSLRVMGLFDDVVTDEDTEAGIAWIESMKTDDGYFLDPALMERKTPGWADDEPWPSSAMIGASTAYATNVLRCYLRDEEGTLTPKRPPPPDWPTVETADTALDWIRSRPWATNPWGAGSHSMRVASYLLEWHKEGKIGIDPFIDAVRFFYEQHDPETGLYGAPETPLHCRINGLFKVFVLTLARLDLPMPYARPIIDRIFDLFHRPDYDTGLGGCTEWDNWYVLCMCRGKAPGYREEEIRKTAAWRLIRDFEIFSCNDGGLSSDSSTCTTNWCGYDMAPAVHQGDAMGPGTVTPSIRTCAWILDIDDPPWLHSEVRPRLSEPEAIRQTVVDRLGLHDDAPGRQPCASR